MLSMKGAPNNKHASLNPVQLAMQGIFKRENLLNIKANISRMNSDGPSMATANEQNS